MSGTETTIEPSAADVIEVRTLAANLRQLADLIADTVDAEQ